MFINICTHNHASLHINFAYISVSFSPTTCKRTFVLDYLSTLISATAFTRYLERLWCWNNHHFKIYSIFSSSITLPPPCITIRHYMMFLYASPPELDQPPVANVMSSPPITLPARTATLDGSHSTDDKGGVSYLWTRDDSSPAAGVRWPCDYAGPNIKLWENNCSLWIF